MNDRFKFSINRKEIHKMTVKELLDKEAFSLVVEGDLSREIEKIYCCDLLSIVMSRAPADCAWVTVMGNVNAAAVASLADMSCIVLAEGAAADEVMLAKAKDEQINVLRTELPVFEAAMLIKGGENA